MTKVVQESGVTIFVLGPKYDSLDMDELDRLGGLLLDMVEQSDQPPRFVIDLKDTRYVGSMFIEKLFRAWKRLQENGGAMALCCLNDFCLEVLEITNLTRIWTICKTREEAIRSVLERA